MALSELFTEGFFLSFLLWQSEFCARKGMVDQKLCSWLIEGFTQPKSYRIIRRTYGEMAEWLKAPVLKTGIRL